MEQRLARGRVSRFNHLADVGLEGAQVLIAERLRRLAVFDGELLAPGFQADQALGELLDALAAGVLGHGAGLEGTEVALKRAVRLSDLGVDAPELRLAPRALLVELGERFLDRAASAPGRARRTLPGSRRGRSTPAQGSC